MKNISLFRDPEKELIISKETYQLILGLLVKDLYRNQGTGRGLRARKVTSGNVVDNYCLPPVRIIVIDERKEDKP